jgi:hypothetical protein
MSLNVYVYSDCQKVARGELPKQVFLQDCLRQMRACFVSCMADVTKLDAAMAKYFAAFGSASNIACKTRTHTTHTHTLKFAFIHANMHGISADLMLIIP